MQLNGIMAATGHLGGVFAVCLLLALNTPGARSAETSPVVTVITDDNFDNVTASGVWIIKVYAPWCTHCRQLEPLWQALGEEGAAEGVKVGKVREGICSQLLDHGPEQLSERVFMQLMPLGVPRIGASAMHHGHLSIQPFTSVGPAFMQVDGTQEKVLMTRFKVNAFPSIFLLRDGQCWSYSGPRNVDAVSRHACHACHASPSSMTLMAGPRTRTLLLAKRLGAATYLGACHAPPTPNPHASQPAGQCVC